MDTIHNGCIVFYRTTSRAQPLLPQTLELLAQQYHVPTTMLPTYAGDRAAVVRAMQKTRTESQRKGWLLRPIKATATRISQAIVAETKDELLERVDHTFEEAMVWDGEEQSTAIQGTHDLARIADAHYQTLRGHIHSDDWTEAIGNYLVHVCHAQMMRADGRIYWVPPDAVPDVEQLKAFLHVVGISVITTKVEGTEVPDVQEALAENLLTQLQGLAEEVQGFDGTQQAITYKTRLTTYKTLRGRLIMYKETLGVLSEKMQDLLGQLEDKVQDLLTLRSRVVMHKDGSMAQKGLPERW